MATAGYPRLEAANWNPRPVLQPAGTATFSATRIAWHAALIVALLLVNKLGAAGAGIFFFVLFCLIASGPEAAFMAFILGALGLSTNMALVPKTIPWTPLRLALLFACALRFTLDLGALRQSLFSRRHYVALVLFVAAAALCSIASGYFVQIALLKLVSFWVGMTAILGGVMVLRARKADLTEWFVALAYAVGFNGLLALKLGVGYGMRTVTTSATGNNFFQGPFYHPNACGPLSAVFIVLLASTWLFGNYRNRWLCLPLLPVFFAFLWMSRSRTGLFTLIAGLAMIFLLTGFAAVGRRYRLRLNMSRTGIVALAAATALTVFMVDLGTGGKITSAAFSYLIKYDQGAEAIETKSLLATRQALIDTSLEHFWERPLTGIGFEVSTSEYFVQNASLFSAPIEKGFLPTAILEEVGILGTIPFVLFLAAVAASLYKTSNATGLAVFLTYLITNLGEVTIFAMGGSGALAWLLVGAGVLIGDHCLVDRRPATQPRTA